VADVCFAGIFGETACAERGFWVVKRGEVAMETRLETAAETSEKICLFFTFLRLFSRNF
jgi:hypothetical protein